MKPDKKGKALIAMVLAFSTMAAVAGGKNAAEIAKQINGAAVLLMQKGDAKGAVLKFHEALAVDPGCGEATRNLAKILLAAKRCDEAWACLAAGVAASPDDEQTLVPYVQVGAMLGKRAECVEALGRLVHAKDATLLPGLSLLLVKQGAHDMALVAAEKALSVDAKDPARWFNKGLALDGLKRWKDAVEAYSRATVLDDRHFGAWINQGNDFERIARFDEMVACYEKAHLLQPRNTLAQYNLGRTLTLRKLDVERGLALLQEATRGKDASAQAARKLLLSLIARFEKKGGVK